MKNHEIELGLKEYRLIHVNFEILKFWKIQLLYNKKENNCKSFANFIFCIIALKIKKNWKLSKLPM
jgi:hypothetical protein